MYVCICVCVHVCTCVWMHVEARVVAPQELPTLSLEARPLPGLKLTKQAMLPGSCLHLPKAGFTSTPHRTQLCYMVVGIELRSSCFPGKHSNVWLSSSSWKFSFFLPLAWWFLDLLIHGILFTLWFSFFQNELMGCNNGI